MEHVIYLWITHFLKQNIISTTVLLEGGPQSRKLPIFLHMINVGSFWCSHNFKSVHIEVGIKCLNTKGKFKYKRSLNIHFVYSNNLAVLAIQMILYVWIKRYATVLMLNINSNYIDYVWKGKSAFFSVSLKFLWIARVGDTVPDKTDTPRHIRYNTWRCHVGGGKGTGRDWLIYWIWLGAATSSPYSAARRKGEGDREVVQQIQEKQTVKGGIGEENMMKLWLFQTATQISYNIFIVNPSASEGNRDAYKKLR